MQQAATYQSTTQKNNVVAAQFDGDRAVYRRASHGMTSHVAKRTIDLVIVLPTMIFLSPLLLLISLAIVLDSRGPVIFSQERVGARLRNRDGLLVWESYIFRVHKFRSMVHNADQATHQAYIKAFVNGDVEASAEDNLKFKLVNDSRITRVGRILRFTSLDELPQLLNILKGEMSVVGPRPVPIYEVEEYEEYCFERLAALPGLTGLWQVTGRGNVTFEEMIRMDIEYVRKQSVWFDIKLIMLTIPAVFTGRGARSTIPVDIQRIRRNTHPFGVERP